MKTAGWLLPVILMLTGCTTFDSGQNHGLTLSQALTSIGAAPELAGASMGMIVRDANSGKVLYQTHSDLRMVPASNMKLLTSVAAFGILGPDYRFETRLLTNGRQHSDKLQGDIYLQGSGDPTLQPADLDAFAAQLAQRGIRQIHGRLLLDDSAFDNVPFGQGWSWDDESYAFSAPISALNYTFNLPEGDINVVRVDICPGTSKTLPGVISVYPVTNAVTLINNTTTGDTTALNFNRRAGSNKIVVNGTIAAKSKTYSRQVTVDDPTQMVGTLLYAALKKHGITVRGGIDRAATPENAVVLAHKTSAPLSELALTFLKLSNNSYGEILTKAMGRQAQGKGDWHSGLQTIHQFLSQKGINTDALRQVDGSGLSRLNQVTPEQLAAVLLVARKQPWFNVWHNALPVAGEPALLVGGTLRHRMINTPATGRTYAKTGSLTGVSSISGYVDSVTGRPLVFSIISNNYLVPDAQIKALEDKMVVTVASCDATVVCR
ncbi:D-alanyl-D-alanine carboxypeptidase/D-alanyl-D-alanine-endopeptidase [Dickeya sp. CFBP 2040]|uniref:D-alanyl-D-alanine carboxypeptidase/D-alanyl-D-alanine endopeptidase n=1 Tax=Dickeya sp. CFBP 2040 TaxID=2718531 RepID=UPI001446D55E|nr:D-alanyl-D-alanine carboxypeptidase/D-alanyl-D-alanine-endopeptidase [Dickeya sp. CFBP 2040]NKI74813.1 D-alanyl-D-alanine carboxypeptidase/D-alanyl-D-alanine-endopeptidase [Dickeya sp. CFBP 2040]